MYDWQRWIWIGVYVAVLVGAWIFGILTAKAILKVRQIGLKICKLQLHYAWLQRDHIGYERDGTRLCLDSALAYLSELEAIVTTLMHATPFQPELENVWTACRIEPQVVLQARPPFALALEYLDNQQWGAFDVLRPKLQGTICKVSKSQLRDAISGYPSCNSPNSSELDLQRCIDGKPQKTQR